MLVFEGKKRWTIFPPHATPLLRPSYRHGHDPVFDADPHAPHAPDGSGAAAGEVDSGAAAGEVKSGAATGEVKSGAAAGEVNSGAAAGEPPMLRYLDRWEVTLGPIPNPTPTVSVPLPVPLPVPQPYPYP